MDTVTLEQRRAFHPEKLSKVGLFDRDRLRVDLYCLLPGQSQAPHRHEDADKVLVVLEGEALVQVGEEQELLPEGTAVLCPAGSLHGVRNDSSSNVVLLVTVAPRPA